MHDGFSGDGEGVHCDSAIAKKIPSAQPIAIAADASFRLFLVVQVIGWFLFVAVHVS